MTKQFLITRHPIINTNENVNWKEGRDDWNPCGIESSPFFRCFVSASCWSAAAPSSVKIIPACEFMPTAVTTIRPLPSMTWVPEIIDKKSFILLHFFFSGSFGIGKYKPERSMGSVSSPFFTWSDSPVREDSSTFKSLLWIRIPSAGSKSPYLTCK